MHRYLLHNAEIRPVSEAVFTAGQVGLLSGWGVFSTIKVVEGVPFAWERHWARMSRDAALMHVPMPEDGEEVRRNVLRLIEANQAPHATLRLVVVRNGGGLWDDPSVGRPSDVIALTTDLKHWGGGVRLDWAPQGRHAASVFRGVKVISWCQNLTYLEQAQQRGFDEVVLLNERGEVSECTSANLFVAEGRQVWTPPLDSGCLPGVTRDLLLEEIRVPGYEVGEKTLYPQDLESAREVFVTSTTRDLLPVTQLGTLARENHGGAREALNAALSRYIDAYVAAHRAPAASR